MLASKLVRLIEAHWETITSTTIRELRQDRAFEHIARLPDSELLEWGEGILSNLSRWILESREGEVAERYEGLGKLRFQEAVPLHEAVRGLQVLKDVMVEFVRNQGLGHTAMEIYVEEELEHRLGKFFDYLVYHLVHGYETALRKAAHMAA
jgi:hypothetical protein